MKNLINKIKIKNNNKLKKTLPVILLLLLITIIIGVTYAAYLITLQSSENSITTGLVSMSYTESTNVITIENALPMSDTDGKSQEDYFDFSVTSNLTLDDANPKGVASYSIEIEPISVDTGYTALNDNQIKLYLEDITNNKVLVNSKLISSLSKYTLYTASHKHTKSISSVTTKYRLRAWIDYAVDSSKWNSSNKYEYKFRVNVNGDVDITRAAVIPIGTATGQIASQVKTTAISYKYKNGANTTVDGATYNVNDNGVFLYDGTDDNGGDYPIYYYRGNVNNNNVIFANMCWKIVRTTSTGGTKLIYNGVPDDSSACNNTETASQIGTSAFNSNNTSPADVGYMYGTRYKFSEKKLYWYSLAGYYNLSSEKVVSSKSSMSSTSYYYGDSVTYSDGTYVLNNAETHTWSSDYSNLKGYYTFFNSNTSSTSKPYYIVDCYSDRAYYTTYGLEKLGLGKTLTYSDGKYTIADYALVDKKDYYSSYSTYKGYYLCWDNTNSCSSIRYLDVVYSTEYYYVLMSNGKTYDSIYEELENTEWLYGNDVEYSNGTYTLKDTIKSKPLNWSSDRITLANGHHYTCFNETGTCTSVYYITSFNSSSDADYLTFTGGDDLDNAKTKMYTNTTNSTIKTYIDSWYSENLTDYTSYLEDTIFCNDRSFASEKRSSGTDIGGSLSNKDANPGKGMNYYAGAERIDITYQPSLSCINQNDRFSLNTNNGGTTGYGNNALTYPTGLLTSDEVMLAGGQSVYNSNYYLHTGQTYWLLSPEGDTSFFVFGFYVDSNGRLYRADGYYMTSSLGVRPVISLKLGTTFQEGTTGTSDNPYIVVTQ